MKKVSVALIAALLVSPAFADRITTDPTLAVDSGMQSASFRSPNPYSTGFEPPVYSLGNVNGQDGWITTNDGTVFDEMLVVDSPAQGAQSLQSIGGDGNFFPGPKAAFRNIGAPSGPGGSVSWDWYFDSASADPFGADQQFIVQSPTDGSVVTRIQRHWDTETLRVLDATSGVFVDLGFDITQDSWENFELTVGAGGAIELFINGSSVFTGTGFTANIEEVAVFNDNYAGNDMYVDNINIVPEPATALLLALSGLALIRRR